MLVRMTVSGLTIASIHQQSHHDPEGGDDGNRSIPIWIGLLEATAIASELESVKFARPMTHDLLKNIILDLWGPASKWWKFAIFGITPFLL